MAVVVGSVQAAEVYTVDFFLEGEQLSNILYVGDVQEGDTDRLKAAIDEVFSRGRTLNAVHLYSYGGTAKEGVVMGRMLRDLYASVVAPSASTEGVSKCEKPEGLGPEVLRAIDEHCDCASACAIAWLGGVHREGFPGFHRAYSTDLLTPLPLQGRRTEEVNRMVREYVIEMNGPSWLVDIINQTGRKAVHRLTPEQQDSLRVDPYFRSHVEGICADLTGQDFADCMNRARLDIFRQGYDALKSTPAPRPQAVPEEPMQPQPPPLLESEFDLRGIEIVYFRKARDGPLLDDIFESAGIVLDPDNDKSSEGVFSTAITNQLTCTPDVPGEAIRQLALILHDGGVQLRSIDISNHEYLVNRLTVETCDTGNNWAYYQEIFYKCLTIVHQIAMKYTGAIDLCADSFRSFVNFRSFVISFRATTPHRAFPRYCAGFIMHRRRQVVTVQTSYT
jgi:hypothetical protein